MAAACSAIRASGSRSRPAGRTDCPYCGRTFIDRAGAAAGAEIAAEAPPGVQAGDPSAAVDAEPQG